jgi:hypothetical protein
MLDTSLGGLILALCVLAQYQEIARTIAFSGPNDPGLRGINKCNGSRSYHSQPKTFIPSRLVTGSNHINLA